MSGLKCDASVSAAASPILCVCVRRLNTLATVWNCVGCGAAVLRWRRVGWMKRETHSKQLCFHTSRYVTRSLSGRTPPIRQPALQQQWSLPNRFHTAQGHCGACRKIWRLTESDLCSRGKTQTMSDIVYACTFMKLDGVLSTLHSADDDVVQWLANLRRWTCILMKKDTHF